MGKNDELGRTMQRESLLNQLWAKGKLVGLEEDGPESADALRNVLEWLESEFSESPDLLRLGKKKLEEYFPSAWGAITKQQVWRPVSGGGMLGALTVKSRISGNRGNAGVFEVRTALGRQPAIKVAGESREISGLIEDRAKILHEAQLLRDVYHPNVIEVYDASRYKLDNGNGATQAFVIVQELIAGKTLAELIEELQPSGGHEGSGQAAARRDGSTKARRGFDERRAVEIVGTITETLAYLHERTAIHKPQSVPSQEMAADRILHLDLKPDNVMIRTEDGKTRGREGDVVLIDFGSAARGDVSYGGFTPGYRCPESRVPNAQPTPQWDIYNLGGILYFLITGDNPPDSPLSTEPIEKATTDPTICTFLRRCHADDPSQRFETASEAAQVLRQWYFDFPVKNSGCAYSITQQGRLLIRRCRHGRGSDDLRRLWSIVFAAITTPMLIGAGLAFWFGVANDDIKIPVRIWCWGFLFVTWISTSRGDPVRYAVGSTSRATRKPLLAQAYSEIMEVLGFGGQDRGRASISLGMRYLVFGYLASLILVRQVVAASDDVVEALGHLLVTAIFSVLMGICDRDFRFMVGPGVLCAVTLIALRVWASPEFIARTDVLINYGFEEVFSVTFILSVWTTRQVVPTFTADWRLIEADSEREVPVPTGPSGKAWK